MVNCEQMCLKAIAMGSLEDASAPPKGFKDSAPFGNGKKEYQQEPVLLYPGILSVPIAGKTVCVLSFFCVY